MNAKPNTRPIIVTALAVSVLITLGYAAAASPQLKEHATTIAIVVLALMSLSGILAALIAPFTRIHTVARQHRRNAPTGASKAMASTSTGASS